MEPSIEGRFYVKAKEIGLEEVLLWNHRVPTGSILPESVFLVMSCVAVDF